MHERMLTRDSRSNARFQSELHCANLVLHHLHSSFRLSIGLGFAHGAVLGHCNAHIVLRHRCCSSPDPLGSLFYHLREQSIFDGRLADCAQGSLLVALVYKFGESICLDELTELCNSYWVSAFHIHRKGKHDAGWVHTPDQHREKIFVLSIANEAIVQDEQGNHAAESFFPMEMRIVCSSSRHTVRTPRSVGQMCQVVASHNVRGRCLRFWNPAWYLDAVAIRRSHHIWINPTHTLTSLHTNWSISHILPSFILLTAAIPHHKD